MSESINTDRELWRDFSEDAESAYCPHVFVTQDGGVGIAVGGAVFVKTLREWHKLAFDDITSLPASVCNTTRHHDGCPALKGNPVCNCGGTHKPEGKPTACPVCKDKKIVQRTHVFDRKMIIEEMPCPKCQGKNGGK